MWTEVDKAPRLSIRIVIWILPSDTVFVNPIKISANTETAMLSRLKPLNAGSPTDCGVPGSEIPDSLGGNRPLPSPVAVNAI